MIKNYKLLINNEWLDASDGKTFSVSNPANGEEIATVASASREDVQKAILSARKAFDEGPWPKMNALQRGNVLRKVADALSRRADEFADLETADVGKPIAESRAFDIPMTVEAFSYYASLIVSVSGEHIPAGEGLLDYTIKEPMGVVAAITPWNFPLSLAVRKLAPALAAGNTVVVKPSSLAPLSTVLLGEIFLEAGLPEGVVNIVTGSGSTVGDELAKSPLVDKISFTGSTEVGESVMCCSAEQIRSTSLELGGKSPAIVLKDADLDRTVKGILFGAFLNQGECCCALTRILVEESVYEEFLELLVEKTKNIRVGVPTDQQTQMGPLISKEHLDKTLEYIKSGLEEGARLVCGGNAPVGSQFEKGYYLEPTVFADVTSDMRIYREEIFGPVLCVSSFEDEEALINAANDTAYGLAAGIFTENDRKAHVIARQLKAGTVWLNIANFVMSNAPYGGYGLSGLGRELGKEGLEMYMQTKNVISYLDANPFSWYE